MAAVTVCSDFGAQEYKICHFFPIYSFPGGLDGKESACNAGDLGSIPGLGRSPGGGHGNLVQYSCLENPRGQKSLAGYSSWGCRELDTTEWLSTHSTQGAQSFLAHNSQPRRQSQYIRTQRLETCTLSLSSEAVTPKGSARQYFHFIKVANTQSPSLFTKNFHMHCQMFLIKTW